MSVLRKIGRILLLVGGILALLDAVSCFFMIIGGAVVAVLASQIAAALEGQIQGVTLDQLVMYVTVAGAVLAVLCLFGSTGEYEGRAARVGGRYRSHPAITSGMSLRLGSTSGSCSR